MPVYKFQPQLTPKTKLGGIFAAVVGLGVGALMLFVGVFVGVALLAIGAVFVLGLKLRLWWQGRFRGNSSPQSGFEPDAASSRRSSGVRSGDVLEGEYEVVKKPGDQP